MAADPSKTEKGTQKRIDDARNKGNTMSSPDVLSFFMLLAGVILMYFLVPIMAHGFETAMKVVSDVDCRVEWTNEKIIYGVKLFMSELAYVMLPMMFGICFFATIIMRVQIGKYFSTKTLMWKFDSFNPKQGIQSLLPKKDNFIKLGITLGKVAVISSVVYMVISGDFTEIMTLSMKPIKATSRWTALRCFTLVLKVLIPIFFLAVIDYIHKRKQYYDNLKMSKQEVKDEHKNAQGDPAIKAKIRQKMMEILRSGMMSDVAKSDVVVTNPTHVAVAIVYVPGEYAPRIAAKGLRKQADSIKELASGLGIPVVEVPALARSLYRNIEIGEYISEEYFGAVAAVLAKLKNASDKVSALRNQK